jgi:hypothetical protein
MSGIARRLVFAAPGGQARPRAAALHGDTMDETQIAKRLEMLRIEHRDLDSAIAALFETGSTDQLQLARLKKRKLRLRDEIALFEDQMIPDIIA